MRSCEEVGVVCKEVNGGRVRENIHTGEFPMGVGHRVENGWGLTKVAVVLLNGLIW